MSKEEFVAKCRELGVPLNSAIKGWNKLQTLEGYIRKNWKVFENLQKYSRDTRLRLREYAAEKGFEYTPYELDKLIEVIGLVQENMKK